MWLHAAEGVAPQGRVRTDQGTHLGTERVDPSRSHVNWAVVYQSVEEMTEKSTIIVHGRVGATSEDGPKTGDGQKDATIQFRELQITPTRIIRGEVSGSISVLQEGWDLFPPESVPEGVPTRHAYSPDGMRWAYADDEVLMFLIYRNGSNGEPRLVLQNSQGLYFVNDGMLESAVPGQTNGNTDPVISGLAGRQVADVTRALAG